MIVALVVCFVRFHSIFHIILLKRFQNHAVGLRIIREKVFKNGRSEIFYRLSSTNFTWSILDYFVPYVFTTIPVCSK